MRTCVRCGYENKPVLVKRRGEPSYEEDRDICSDCGCNMNRPCRKKHKRGKIGGKRGRNSGTTNKSKTGGKK